MFKLYVESRVSAWILPHTVTGIGKSGGGIDAGAMQGIETGVK